MIETKPETLMEPMRQALRFFVAQFVPLTLICILYTLPAHFFLSALENALPQLTKDESIESAFKLIALALLVLLLFTPFRQAAQIHVMTAKRSGKPWTLLGTVTVGVTYWQRLFVVNLIRMAFTIALVLSVYFSAGLTTGMAANLGMDISKGVAAAAGLMLLVGVNYLVARLAYFDFLIVLEQYSILDSIKLSFQMTRTHAGKLLFHLLALSIALVLLRRGLLQVFDGWLLELIMFLVFISLLNLAQVLCFTYFWNTRHVPNPDGPSLNAGANTQSRKRFKHRRKT